MALSLYQDRQDTSLQFIISKELAFIMVDLPKTQWEKIFDNIISLITKLEEQQIEFVLVKYILESNGHLFYEFIDFNNCSCLGLIDCIGNQNQRGSSCPVNEKKAS
ncbi:MAG: hypothetical protein H6623_07135 [Bdellovibrionaceae bacterium]|nr:hypothetical protein [Pseudobdellovibrionaceae bacterium]